MPVQIPECGHTFGDHCIVGWLESNNANANKCPLCRITLFKSEHVTSEGNAAAVLAALQRINETGGGVVFFSVNGVTEHNAGTLQWVQEQIRAQGYAMVNGMRFTEILAINDEGAAALAAATSTADRASNSNHTGGSVGAARK